jgi:ClpP class serine protease
VAVNGVGKPQLARWAFVAFNVSEEKAEARSKMIHEAANEIEEHRLMMEQMAKEKELRDAAMKIFEMKQVMKAQLQDEERNQELMMEEWGYMSNGMALERVVPNMQEQVSEGRPQGGTAD